MAKITKVKTDYITTIQNFISSQDGIIDFDEVVNLFTVAPATVRSKIKQAMAIDKTLRGRVAGIFPDTETILNEVEARIGKIQGENLEPRGLILFHQHLFPAI